MINITLIEIKLVLSHVYFPERDHDGVMTIPEVREWLRKKLAAAEVQQEVELDSVAVAETLENLEVWKAFVREKNISSITSNRVNICDFSTDISLRCLYMLWNNLA